MKTTKLPGKCGPKTTETIVQTTYFVTVVTTKSAPETNIWIGRQLTPTIDRAIGTAIQKAAVDAVARYVRCGKLDKSFRVAG